MRKADIHDIVVLIIFFMFGLNLVLPFFTRKSEIVLTETSEASQSIERIESLSDWSSSKTWLQNVFPWRLEASPDNTSWYNASSFLTVDLRYDARNQSAKVTLTVNTTHAPEALYYRFILSCKKNAKHYVNDSRNYMYSFTLPINETSDCLVVFNFSDMVPLLQNKDIFVRHGVSEENREYSFWFYAQTCNKIPVGFVFVVDPTFRVNETTSSSATAFPNSRKAARTTDGALHCVFMDENNAIQYERSTDDGQTWTRTQLCNGTYHQYYPAIAVDNANNLHVVWNGTHVGSTVYSQIRYSKYSDGRWSAPTNLTTGNYNQSLPSIAIDSSNSLHVVWQGPHGDSTVFSQIRYSKYSVSWSAPVNLTSGNYNQSMSCLAVDGSDNLHVVWNGTHAGSTVYSQIRYSKYSGSWSAPVNLTSGNYNQSMSCLVVDSTNNLHVVWQGYHAGSTSYSQVRYTKYSGTWSEPANITSDEYSQQNPSIAIDSSNTLHLIWSGKHAGSTTYSQIRCANYTDSWDAIDNLTSDDTNHQNYPSSVFAEYPKINGIRTNIPKTGFCFLWIDTHDQNVSFYATSDLTWQKTWWNRTSGWCTFQNTSSYEQIQLGWFSFSNTSSFEQRTEGWLTFGNTSSFQQTKFGFFSFTNTSQYEDVVSGWYTFTNSSEYESVSSGWFGFSNESQYNAVVSGWLGFGNVSSYEQIGSGFCTFANTSRYEEIVPGWFTVQNSSGFETISAGWFGFGNVSSFEQRSSGYFTFSNLSQYGSILSGWFPFTNSSGFESVSSGWFGFSNESQYDTVCSGWLGFGNESSFEQVVSGFCSFGNLSQYNTVLSGWFTFVNSSGFETVSSGWFIFGNVSSFEQRDSGYFRFSNVSQYGDVLSGWFTVANSSGYETVSSGWFGFGNVSSFDQMLSGWVSFGNASSFTQIKSGYWSFGNSSQYDTVASGWCTLANTSGYTGVVSGWFNFSNYSSFKDFNDVVSGWTLFGNTTTFHQSQSGWFSFLGTLTYDNPPAPITHTRKWKDTLKGWFSFSHSSPTYILLKNEYPADGSTYVYTPPTNLTQIQSLMMGIMRNCSNGSQMNTTIWFNGSLLFTNTSWGNGSLEFDLFDYWTGTLQNGTVYTWTVQASTPQSSTNETYSFLFSINTSSGGSEEVPPISNEAVMLMLALGISLSISMVVAISVILLIRRR